MAVLWVDDVALRVLSRKEPCESCGRHVWSVEVLERATGSSAGRAMVEHLHGRYVAVPVHDAQQCRSVRAQASSSPTARLGDGRSH